MANLLLVANTLLKHRQKKPLPCHVIYTCATNLIYREGGGILKIYKFIMHKQEVQSYGSMQDIGWHSGSLSEDCYTKFNSSIIQKALRFQPLALASYSHCSIR